MEDKREPTRIIATITCIKCDESFSGLTQKQADRYMRMHNCKGVKDE